MPLKIGPTGQDEVTPVSFAGHLGTADLSAGISELAAKLDQGGRYLVDFRHCAIEATAAEFMGLIDHWFATLGTDTPMAVLMDGQAQGDHAMLFETKGFLLGSRLKAFTSLSQARDWLAGKGQPGNRPSLQTR